MCPIAYPSLGTSLLENVHCNESKISGLGHHRYWILVKTPPCYPVVALCHGDAALGQQDWPFYMSQAFQMTDILGWANSEPWIWAWVEAELVNLPALPLCPGE